MARLPGPPEDSGMMEEAGGPPRLADPRAGPRRSRLPPDSGREGQRPKLPLSKRKLELLLAEPEKSKRKKQYVV